MFRKPVRWFSSSSNAFRSEMTPYYPIGLYWQEAVVLATPFLFWCTYESSPSFALGFAWQLRCYTSPSSRFIFLLIILYTLFLIFHCHLSVLTYFVHGTLPVHIKSKIFQFAYYDKSFQNVFGHASFLLSTVLSVFLLSALLCTHTALLERLLSAVV